MKQKDLGINKEAKRLVEAMKKEQKKEIERLIKKGKYYSDKREYE